MSLFYFLVNCCKSKDLESMKEFSNICDIIVKVICEIGNLCLCLFRLARWCSGQARMCTTFLEWWALDPPTRVRISPGLPLYPSQDDVQTLGSAMVGVKFYSKPKSGDCLVREIEGL